MSPYRRILVAVDGSAAANKGLREALRLANAGRAKLFIVHVVDEFYAFAGYDGLGPTADLVRATAVLREMIGGPAAGPIVREAVSYTHLTLPTKA